MGKPTGAKLAFEELKIVCPRAPGRYFLGDIHEVLIRILGDMERLNETQKEIEADMKERSQRLGTSSRSRGCGWREGMANTGDWDQRDVAEVVRAELRRHA